MTLTVRPAVPEEAEDIQRLGRATWHAAYDDVFGPSRVDRVVDHWWSVESLRDAADAAERTFLVAEADGVLLGVVDAHPDTERARTYHVGRLYVHPDRWGEGIGTGLVDELRERIPESTERIRLLVLADNPVGISFYESYGFERVGERTGETDGVEHEEYVYELSLSPQN